MTEEKATLLMIRGHISVLSEQDQSDIKSTADKIKEVVKEADSKQNGIGVMALALVGAELAAE